MGSEAKSPGPEPTLDDILAELERNRLFKIIEQLVQWENTTNEEVLNQARAEIWASWRRNCAENAGHPRAAELFDRNKLPSFHDPFAGGGALPLEAQRLGLETYATDLNPVPVLINKAMIELPSKFSSVPPVNPEARTGQLGTKSWRRGQGLADDVRYYGMWMRDEAHKRIGRFYPKISITAEMAKERPDLESLVGEELTVIAWLWARTVKSPNPAFREVDVPLASTFMLSTKPGKSAWIEPIIENNGYRLCVRIGEPTDADAAKAGTKLARGANFRCVMSGTPIAADYIKAEGKAGRMGMRMMAIVAEGKRGRIYLSPTPDHENASRRAKPEWQPDVEFFQQALGFRVGNYGMTRWSDLFTQRQLMSLSTYSDLIAEALGVIQKDAFAAGMQDDQRALRDGGSGATAYSEAVGVYLGICVDKIADRSTTICGWDNGFQKITNTFGMQILSMKWDFAEANSFSGSSGSIDGAVNLIAKCLDAFPAAPLGFAAQDDAATQTVSLKKVISTDPPYYDNIGYADLSDFFYVWLRRSLHSIYPNVFATVSTPKAEELVATPARHGGKEEAERFFLSGMTGAMHRLTEQAHPGFPVSIYYAFKQSENESDSGTASTGWETFLDAVIQAGFRILGTWPMRTEYTGNLKAQRNALASSIVLVCRPRANDAPTATRREFVTALQEELPKALRHLQAGNIAPVDLAQAAIGPGMAVFTRYRAVLKADAKGAEDKISVRDALALINETLDTALAEQEGDFDSDSRWALAWFDQNGFDAGEYGVAETLSKAKNTSVSGLVDGGILESSRGKVRLLKPDELPSNWDPSTDSRLTHWETVHHLIRVLTSGGEAAASDLVKKLGAKAEAARELAYRLYTVCERKKRATEALSYNALVQSWPEILRQAQEGNEQATPVQQQLL